MSWPTNDPDHAQRGHTGQNGPVDPPPFPGASPIPPYSPPPPQSPPQPGTWGPGPGDGPQPHQGGWAPQPHQGGWAPQDTVPGPTLTPHQRPQLRYAHWGERVGATLIDVALVVAVTALFAMVTFGLFEDARGLLGVAAWGWIAWLNGSKGQSPGKAIMGLKLVRDVDGTTLGGPVGLVRTLLLWVIGAFSIGLFWLLTVLWPAWDPKKQALHDKMFGAVVISGHPQAKFGKGIFLP